MHGRQARLRGSILVTKGILARHGCEYARRSGHKYNGIGGVSSVHFVYSRIKLYLPRNTLSLSETPTELQSPKAARGQFNAV